MGAPLTATGRIALTYTVDVVPHKLHAYVKNPTLVSNAWFIDDRDGGVATLAWENCVEKLIDAMNALASSTCVMSPAVLEEKVGLIWVPRAVHSYLGTPTGSPTKAAVQMTATFRTQGFYRTKVVNMEGIISADSAKITTPTGGVAAMDTFLSYFTGSHAGANDPFEWWVGADEKFILEDGFVSATFALNRKVRKTRGMA